jgi:hypothetical protein
MNDLCIKNCHKLEASVYGFPERKNEYRQGRYHHNEFSTDHTTPAPLSAAKNAP